MYVRIVRAQTKPGQFDELGRRWEQLFARRVRDMPGFQHAYFAVNHDTDSTVGVTMWEREPDPKSLGAALRAYQEQARDLLTGSTTIQDYEIEIEI
jgi:heme-degrading monooxygenase HmoA